MKFSRASGVLLIILSLYFVGCVNFSTAQGETPEDKGPKCEGTSLSGQCDGKEYCRKFSNKVFGSWDITGGTLKACFEFDGPGPNGYGSLGFCAGGTGNCRLYVGSNSLQPNAMAEIVNHQSVKDAGDGQETTNVQTANVNGVLVLQFDRPLAKSGKTNSADIPEDATQKLYVATESNAGSVLAYHGDGFTGYNLNIRYPNIPGAANGGGDGGPGGGLSEDNTMAYVAVGLVGAVGIVLGGVFYQKSQERAIFTEHGGYSSSGGSVWSGTEEDTRSGRSGRSNHSGKKGSHGKRSHSRSRSHGSKSSGHHHKSRH